VDACRLVSRFLKNECGEQDESPNGCRQIVFVITQETATRPHRPRNPVALRTAGPHWATGEVMRTRRSRESVLTIGKAYQVATGRTQM